ncbi:hypothetical protein F2Q69_00006157 [Brassica cretica]|uniref:Uncharacterized protein n=1 Tax=Brassica cretica TaxID=69181 RepID=A0A8S9PEQ0_BRACR|nr:hypothetical protein F2Q69_00006157 [Brassica cretica]
MANELTRNQMARPATGSSSVGSQRAGPPRDAVPRSIDQSRPDAPKSNGEADSSADEEQPANRRRIEVILSQKTLSSDDENDDTPVLEDLRDVLKRKFESEIATAPRAMISEQR